MLLTIEYFFTNIISLFESQKNSYEKQIVFHNCFFYKQPLKIIQSSRVKYMRDIDFGEIRLHLDEIRKKQGISINKLAYRAEMQRSQVRSYCNNLAQRLD